MTDSSSTTEATTNPTLYIVDGSAYIYRAFYAVRHLSNSRGLPTNALYGFVNMIKKLIEQEDPDYIAVTFDRYDEEDEGKSFRHELYTDYKANRNEMPEDLRKQVPYFGKFIEALNIPVLIQSGVEADDVIATITKQAREEELDVCIVSADKDLMQLLTDEHVRMIDTMRDKTFTTKEVHERFNVSPDKVKYVLALAGDTSDNVPGVPGIGEKTAGQLIEEWGDLENLLANTDKITAKKRRENLETYAEQARLSLELVTLKEDCDIEFDLDKLVISKPDIDALTALLIDLEFHSTLKSLNAWIARRGWSPSVLAASQQHEERSGQQLLFASGTSKPASKSAEGEKKPQDFSRPGKNYTTVFTEKELDEVIAALQKSSRYGFDLETTSLEALDAEIVGLSFSWEENQGVYIPVAHDYEDAPTQLDRAAVLAKLKPLLEDEQPKKIGQHVKYERIVLHKYDIHYKGILFDTMLMGYLLDPSRMSHGLDAMALDYLQHVNLSYEEVAGKGKKQISFSKVPIDIATNYAAEDSDITLMLANKFEPMLEDKGLRKLHDEMELPLSEVLARMELQGVCVDSDMLHVMSKEFDEELKELQKSIDESAEQDVETDGHLNPNSPKQLREVLFERLGLPVKKRTKSGPSTDQSVLEELASQHELPELILEYRKFAKLKGTYVDALPSLIRTNTRRVHTDFNQAVTATGRLSSSNPNLQNIPIRTARGRQIRKAFVPQKGWKLLGADYSQIELRILAHMSGEPLMLKAYQNDEDIHALTASNIFHVPLEEVTGEQRARGKTVNFAVIYGVGAQTLAKTLKVTQTEAKTYIENYFAKYTKINEFFDSLVEGARKDEVVHTMFGRVRHLPEINGGGGNRAFAERVAKNTPIQGTAADIIKLAMIEVQRRIDEGDLPMHMLLQVHDELLFEVDPDFIEQAKILVSDCMENVVELDVPLKAEPSTGDNWLDAK